MHLSRSELLTAIRAEKEARKSEEDRARERVGLLGSHLTFTKRFFLEKEGQPFSVAPFHQVICGTLDRVFAGEIKRLIINIPPGYGKTELAVINFIARGFAINPRARFIHASYAEPLALDNSTKVKDVISLPGYQAHWPVTMRPDQNAKGLWRTTAGGHLRAAAAGQPITGFRAGILAEPGFTGALIIDDPLKPDDASSDTMRKFINARWENTFKSRLAHEDVPVIVIMQRLHVDDFVAHLLENSGEHWHLLKLPVLIEGEGQAPAGDVELIPHGLPNGPLWDQKHTLAQIKVLQSAPHVYSGQYAQEPTVEGGNLFKPGLLPRYDVLPKLSWRAIYVDTAQKTKERNDYTVFEHWGAGVDGKAYLLEVVRDRFEAPELEKTAFALWSRCRGDEWPADRYGHLRKMAIEDKVSGTGLIQSLTRKAIPVIAMQREKDKYTRALDVVPAAAAGLIVLPKTALWLKDFENELAAFPDGGFDDQVDPFIDAALDICGFLGLNLDNL
ncbi:phage terminase large subunit [Aquamicrobium soli]|uniref:Phage terminase large subunit n=1 Tax=Aquamicrobium soli TaxID=1811518 RepID=A0ABV7KCX1_9HYPH